eukprot:2559911-Prymnesium_polylepis.2
MKEYTFEPSPTSVLVKRPKPIKLCSICAKPARHRCRKCPTLYCSAECRDVDMTTNDHEATCYIKEPDEVGGVSLFGVQRLSQTVLCGPLLSSLENGACETDAT